jgi:hypothetical protein
MWEICCSSSSQEAAKELSVAEGKLPEPASLTASSSSSTPAPPAIQDLSTVPYLEPADELLLIRYYSSTIPRTCAGFGFPEGIEATATSYFKRFYLWNTTMDYHPRKVMCVARSLFRCPGCLCGLALEL